MRKIGESESVKRIIGKCEICGKEHTSQSELEECFMSHSEIELLRWVAGRVNQIRKNNPEELKQLDGELFEKLPEILSAFECETY